MPVLQTFTGQIFAETIGNGFPVVMVPGLGGRAQFWNGQRQDFAARYSLTLIDHRGVGRSPRGPVATSIAEMAADVLAVMDSLGIARAHFIGHSTGGAIGQHIALYNPERIDRLVLSATWAGPDPLFRRSFETRLEILQACGAATYLMAGTLLATPAWFLQSSFREAEDFLGERLRDFAGVEPETIRIRAILAHDLRTEVSRIGHRTLVIGSRDDQITPPGFSEELASLIAGARCVILPEGGHFCPMVVPDRYNQAVLEFLQS